MNTKRCTLGPNGRQIINKGLLINGSSTAEPGGEWKLHPIFALIKDISDTLKVSEDAKLNAVSSPDTLACPSKIFARRRREPFNFMTCQQEEVLSTVCGKNR